MSRRRTPRPSCECQARYQSSRQRLFFSLFKTTVHSTDRSKHYPETRVTWSTDISCLLLVANMSPWCERWTARCQQPYNLITHSPVYGAAFYVKWLPQDVPTGKACGGQSGFFLRFTFSSQPHSSSSTTLWKEHVLFLERLLLAQLRPHVITEPITVDKVVCFDWPGLSHGSTPETPAVLPLPPGRQGLCKGVSQRKIGL